MGNFMLYKSIATYPANFRGLKSQQKLQYWKEFVWNVRPLFSNWAGTETRDL